MKPLRDAFGETLVRLARQRPDIVVLTADIAWSSRVGGIRGRVSRSFHSSGYRRTEHDWHCRLGWLRQARPCLPRPWPSLPAGVLHNQLAISVAYPKLNVKIFGTLTGIYASKTGATHMALEDIAIMRALPNIMVVVPADATELKLLLEQIVDHKGPAYLRVASIVVPDVFQNGYQPTLGQAEVLKEGTDVTLIGTGVMTARTLEAATLLINDRD